MNNFPSDSPLSRDIQGVVFLTVRRSHHSRQRGTRPERRPDHGDGKQRVVDPGSDQAQRTTRSKGDRGGPVVLGGAADHSTISPDGEERVPSGGPKIDRTRLALFADADWAANGFIPEISNQTLLVNTVNWLAGEEDLIAVGGIEPDLRRLTLTPLRQKAMAIVERRCAAVPGSGDGVPALVPPAARVSHDWSG